MKWTKAIPLERGWYWLRELDGKRIVFVPQDSLSTRGWEYWAIGTCGHYAASQLDGTEMWAGPIPEPEEGDTKP